VKGSTAFGRIAALAALAAVIVVVFLLLTGGDEEYEVTAEFTNASQLVGGEVVTVGGTPAGKVGKIELADNGNALVTFTVNEEYTPLREGTIAQVRSYSLSGVANRQIQLTLPPEGGAGPEIESGGTMTVEDTISEVDLDQVFNTLDDETVADFKKVVKGFAISQEGVGEQANEGFRYLNPFLSTSRELFAELTRDSRALEQLIVDGSQLSGALAARRDDISALVGNLDQMMNAIARQKVSLAEGLQKLPPFMRNFNTTAVNLRATLDDLDPLVDASKPVAVQLSPFFRNFRAASADLVPAVRDLDVIIKHPGPDNDLVDLTRLQPKLAKIAIGPLRANGRKVQGAFPESATALADSLDETAFFRAYQPELTGWFDDFGHSGVTDANGGIGRIGTTFNTFSLGANDLPVVDLAGLLATTGDDLFDIGNYKRCPGSNERPAPDGSNPFLDATNPGDEGGQVNCDPTIIPPGN
jgi:phospholipid/cholesterol/gamma-HCH transport system substrate-binding protein